MSEKLVTIYIDGQSYEVPAGQNLVDVAKFYADNDIPVFCYHPKMDPVGMCRMCLVELGSIMLSRETGEIEYDENGEAKIRWFPKLVTACTQTVSDGLVMRTDTPRVQAARDDIIEFILTSHPLDCPICDKGGECPLQNLTMRHGPGKSVFHYSDKMHLAKHVPLGELIYLDRERCIQCARCTRYCEELVGDDVLAFHQRGRALQIVTISDPPFDTKFSGNTTDICPVGALTTADFRFGARPWELKDIPSIDPYTPEGANISLSIRLDRDAGGVHVIKRVMPRQNEYVNEIWISDKTRFGHHHTRAEDRLTRPLIREGNALVETTWEHALQTIQARFEAAKTVGALAGPNQSNEDLWELRKLLQTKASAQLGLWPALMSGGDVVRQVGVATGTNFTAMGSDTVILVVASDLEEEAPIWWLRTKVAGDRGAKIIVANPRPTKLSQYATYNLAYDYGDAVGAINNMVAKVLNSDLADVDLTSSRIDGFNNLATAVKGERARNGFAEPVEALATAENLIILCGSEGLTLEEHAELMQACANLLITTGHVGRPNNGLIPVWPGANTQGAIDMGFTAEATQAILENAPDLLFVAGCDPIGDALEANPLKNAGFTVVTALFETETAAALADVVLPRQSFAEREGTFTNGERRVQRFYVAQSMVGESLPDWKMFAQLHAMLGGPQPSVSAGIVMAAISQTIPEYSEMGYRNLARIERQFPDVGGDDLYYGGTAYQNAGGLGVQWPVVAEDSNAQLTVRPVNAEKNTRDGLVVIPTTVLYDRGVLFKRSALMDQRIPSPYAVFNPADAADHDIADGDSIGITIGGQMLPVKGIVDDGVPEGVILLPRRLTDEPSPFMPVPVEAIEHISKAVVATEG